MADRTYRPKVYIAGPLTTGDRVFNRAAAISTANAVSGLGAVVYVPHLNDDWEMMYPRPYDDWMRDCLDWIDVCDAVVRIGGKSNGASLECEYASGNGVPICQGVPGVRDWMNECWETRKEFEQHVNDGNLRSKPAQITEEYETYCATEGNNG